MYNICVYVYVIIDLQGCLILWYIELIAGKIMRNEIYIK